MGSGVRRKEFFRYVVLVKGETEKFSVFGQIQE